MPCLNFWPKMYQCAKWEEFATWHYMIKCCAKVLQSSLTLCNPMVCSPPDSSVHGILQARILEWVAILAQGHTATKCWSQDFNPNHLTLKAGILNHPVTLFLCSRHHEATWLGGDASWTTLQWMCGVEGWAWLFLCYDSAVCGSNS